MSLPKRLAKIMTVVFFTSFLSAAVLSLAIYDLTGYRTLKGLSRELLLGQAEQADNLISSLCSTSSRIEFSVQNEIVSFECNEVRDADALFNKVFDKVYYRNYSCDILDCIKNPAILASAFGNRLSEGILFVSIAFSVISGIALLLLFDKKISSLAGSLIFVGMNYFLILLAKSNMPDTIKGVNLLLDSIALNFLFILAAGLILAGVGLFTRK
jgi:hypothetical protein